MRIARDADCSIGRRSVAANCRVAPSKVYEEYTPCQFIEKLGILVASVLGLAILAHLVAGALRAPWWSRYSRRFPVSGRGGCRRGREGVRVWGHTSANGGARWTHNALEAHQASQGAAAMREAGRGGARQAGVPRSTKIPAKKASISLQVSNIIGYAT